MTSGWFSFAKKRMLVRTFEWHLDLAMNARQQTIGTGKQTWFLRNDLNIAARVEPVRQID